MAEYSNESIKAVENEQYCVPSMNKRNVDQMTGAMGYNDMGDRANTGKWPSSMHGAKVSSQVMGSTRTSQNK